MPRSERRRLLRSGLPVSSSHSEAAEPGAAKGGHARRPIDWRGWLALAWVLWFGLLYGEMVVRQRGETVRGWIAGRQGSQALGAKLEASPGGPRAYPSTAATRFRN